MGQKYKDKEAHICQVAFSASRNPYHPQDTLLPVGWCAPLWVSGPVKGRHSKRLVVCNVCEINTASHLQMPTGQFILCVVGVVVREGWHLLLRLSLSPLELALQTSHQQEGKGSPRGLSLTSTPAVPSQGPPAQGSR